MRILAQYPILSNFVGLWVGASIALLITQRQKKEGDLETIASELDNTRVQLEEAERRLEVYTERIFTLPVTDRGAIRPILPGVISFSVMEDVTSSDHVGFQLGEAHGVLGPDRSAIVDVRFSIKLLSLENGAAKFILLQEEVIPPYSYDQPPERGTKKRNLDLDF